MPPRRVDRLPREDVNGPSVVSRQRVVRKMHVEVERRDTREPASAIQVPRDRQGRDLLRPGNERWAQAVAVLDGYAESPHQRSRVPPKALLAGHQCIAVVVILDVAHLRIVGDADLVMGTQDQARSLTLEELPEGLDLLRRCVLL